MAKERKPASVAERSETHSDDAPTAQPQPNGAANFAHVHSHESYPSTTAQLNEELDNESPWARKVILCLDGGGIRGYSSLLILKALMKAIERLEKKIDWIPEVELWHEPVRSSAEYPWQGNLEISDSTFFPCHYFDYMAGTSTGGLSAIMLGRLHMSVDEALSCYGEFGDSVFGNARWFHIRSIFWWPRAKYATKVTKKAMLRIVRQGMTQDPNQPPENWDVEQERFAFSKEARHRCQVMVVSNVRTDKLDEPYLYRTFDHKEADGHDLGYPIWNPGEACKEPIWHAARATSAAPLFFEPLVANGARHFDGAIGFNNPSMVALKEVSQMHYHPPKLCISIGTGERTQRPMVPKKKQLDETRQNSRIQYIKKYLEIPGLAKDMLTDTRTAVGDAAFVGRIWGPKFIRLNVKNNIRVKGQCLGEVPLDEWLPRKGGEYTRDKIEDMTRRYLDQEDVQAALESYARELVMLRRQRAVTERWEKYATDVVYECTMTEACKHQRFKTKGRRTFRYHVDELHADCIDGRSEREVADTLSHYRTIDSRNGRRAFSRASTTV